MQLCSLCLCLEEDALEKSQEDVLYVMYMMCVL